MMTELLKEITSSRIAFGDYSSLFGAILKMISDSHTTVSACAIRVTSALLKARKQDFREFAKQAFPVLLPKFFKHVDEILSCLSIILLCGVDLNDLIEYLPELTKQKSPTIRINILNFYLKVAIKSDMYQLQNSKVQLMDISMKYVEDRDPKVRD